jgi:hypothetical protein
VQADEHEILGDREILLDVVGFLLQREPIGRQRVFRRVGRRTAVRDEIMMQKTAISEQIYTRMGRTVTGR